MYETTCYRTADGCIFTNEREARRHAEERYGDALTKLARELCRVGKYTKVIEWLEANEERLAELARRRADLVLHSSEENEESED